MENYATKMRQALSDKNICKPDGSINHQYFLVKKGQYWNDEMQDQLIMHIGKEGIGNWKAMQKGILEHTSDIELELRVCLILKTSDISEHMDQKYTKNEIAQIAKSNYEKGQNSSKVKHGILVV